VRTELRSWEEFKMHIWRGSSTQAVGRTWTHRDLNKELWIGIVGSYKVGILREI
jgi:hypothetical protein